MRRSLAAVTVLALLVFLGACGDDEGSVFGGSTTTAASTTTSGATTTAAPTTTAAVTTTTGGNDGNAFGGLLADALAQGAGSDTAVVTGGEEECVTSGLAQGLGAERFAELDALAAGTTDMSVVFGQMSDSELDTLVGVISDCIDVEALLAEEMTSADLSPEAVACFAQSLSQEETLKGLIQAMVTGEDPENNPEFIAFVVQIMTEDCVEPLEAMLVEQFVASGISQESATCVADRFLRGGLFESLLDTMLSGSEFPTDPDLQNQMMTVFTECLTPEELGNLSGG